ncbi:hypothetical protein MEEL106852_10930 [Megasphaera elsdenii]|uniref:Uncharacterized protein n=1 Tax=Megasphaera elsdenii DSM 20460 TaxID=1064535 RepID=G0VSD0_MEGEL|nr:hypothetical protein [Megasphaera elsdenii]AVO75140.1 hypothetical protein C6362_09445 [Megasphaera elsdenii DSM 20460]CCC74170.1 hypothetical protein MELS_1952 [Megasphaera elsdenii DSM 20460]
MENFEVTFDKFEKAVAEGLKVSLSMKKIDGNKVACTIKGSVNDRSLVCLAIISSLAQIMNVDAIDLVDVLAENAPKLRGDYKDEIPEDFLETLKDLGVEVKQPSDDEEDDEDEEIEELAKIIAKALKNEL